MAEQYIIRFSSDKITAEGKDVTEEKNKQIDDALTSIQAAGGKQKREEIEKLVIIQSKRYWEKDILQSLLQTAFKNATKPQDFKLIADIDATVTDAEESFLINIDEWKKYFQDQFEPTLKALAQRPNAKARDGRQIDIYPYVWKYCKEIMQQLYAPDLNRVEPKKE